MKRWISVLLVLVLFLTLIPFAIADDDLTPEQKAELQEKIEANRALPEHQEGYVEEGDGCYYVVS